MYLIYDASMIDFSQHVIVLVAQCEHILKPSVHAMGCNNRPSPFSIQMLYKATKSGLAFIHVMLC